MVLILITSLFLLSPTKTADVVVVTLGKSDLTVPLAPTGKVDFKREGTITRVKVELERPPLPSAQGPAFNSLVAWAISPEGIVENLGEIAVEKDHGRLESTTKFEQAGLLITAEPHYMVDRPSAAVEFRSQNPRNEDIRRQTVPIEVGTYDYSSIPQSPQPAAPARVQEARVAFEIAKTTQADRFAPQEFRAAGVALETMEQMVARASPFDIVAQSANEAIRRSQQAVTATREKQSAAALESARHEIEVLKQEAQDLNTRLRQLTDQQNALTAQIQKLQADLSAANREGQQIISERDQAVAREHAASRELTDLKSRQEQLQARLVLPLRDDFYNLKTGSLTAAGMESLSRLSGMAETVPGQIRLEGPAPDALFEAARQYLLQNGIPQERVVVKRQ